MKNTLFSALTAAVVRSVVYFQMRSLEITLDGKLKSRDQVTDPFTRREMAVAIANLRTELLIVREKYLSLRPARSWRVAS